MPFYVSPTPIIGRGFRFQHLCLLACIRLAEEKLFFFLGCLSPVAEIRHKMLCSRADYYPRAIEMKNVSARHIKLKGHAFS